MYFQCETVLDGIQYSNRVIVHGYRTTHTGLGLSISGPSATVVCCSAFRPHEHCEPQTKLRQRYTCSRFGVFVCRDPLGSSHDAACSVQPLLAAASSRGQHSNFEQQAERVPNRHNLVVAKLVKLVASLTTPDYASRRDLRTY